MGNGINCICGSQALYYCLYWAKLSGKAERLSSGASLCHCADKGAGFGGRLEGTELLCINTEGETLEYLDNQKRRDQL